MKFLFLRLNLLLIGLAGVLTFRYLSPKGKGTKTWCSLGFVALGTVNWVYALTQGNHIAFASGMLLGLILGCGGDLTIHSSFQKGAALFAAGHVCYIISYCLLVPTGWNDLLWSVVFLLPLAVYVCRSRKLVFRPRAFQGICLGYTVVITGMMAKSITNFAHQPGLLTGCLMLGSMFFLFSDFMLLLNQFSIWRGRFGRLCLATYYPAQLLLSHAIFYCAGQLVL